MKTLFTILFLSALSLFAVAQTSTLFTINLTGPAAGNPPDGFNLYMGCDDQPNKVLVGTIAEGSQDLQISVTNNSTLHFCAAGYITDALANDNEGPLVFATPLMLDLVGVPDVPQSLDINVRCDFPPSGFVCAITSP